MRIAKATHQQGVSKRGAAQRTPQQSHLTIRIPTILLSAFVCLLITLHHRHSQKILQISNLSSPSVLVSTRAPSPSIASPQGKRSVRRSAETVVPFAEYHPTYRYWRDVIFSKSDDDQRADGDCIGWRQTGECDPEGPNEPFFSKSCRKVVGGGSGYCLCVGGIKVKKMHCGHWKFTCADECSAAMKTIRKNSVGGNRKHRLVEAARRLMQAQRVLSQQTARANDAKAILDSISLRGDEVNVSSAEYDSLFEVERSRRQATAEVQSAKWEVAALLRDGGAPEFKADDMNRERRVCRGWKQTKDCDPQGEREVDMDRLCSAVVADGNSGFCDCGTSRPPIAVACSHRPFTCHHACAVDFDISTILKSKSPLPAVDSKGYGSGADDVDDKDELHPTVRVAPRPPRSPEQRLEVELHSSRAFGLAHLEAVRSLSHNKHDDLLKGPARGLSTDEVPKIVSEADLSIGKDLKASLLRVFSKKDDPQAQKQNSPQQRVAGRHLRLPSDALSDPSSLKEFYRHLDHLVEKSNNAARSADKR